jgi:hypothetical protein
MRDGYPVHRAALVKCLHSRSKGLGKSGNRNHCARDNCTALIARVSLEGQRITRRSLVKVLIVEDERKTAAHLKRGSEEYTFSGRRQATWT